MIHDKILPYIKDWTRSIQLCIMALTQWAVIIIAGAGVILLAIEVTSALVILVRNIIVLLLN